MRLDARSILRATGVAVPLVLGLMAGRLVSPWLPSLVDEVARLGMWAPFVFVAAYTVGVVAMFPVFLLIMVGGAVFGTLQGAALALVGALAGGTLAFLIARHYARELVARRVARNPMLASVDRVIGEDGMKLVFLLRLSPTVPFVLSNYALGVTRVRQRDFVLGTFGLIPVILTYAAYGSASGGVRPKGAPPVSPLLLGGGIAATVVLGALLARIVQRAIREAERSRALNAGERMVTTE